MPERSRRRPRPALLALAALAAVAALLLAPATAYARDYEISRVDIDATVSQDGTLHVVETRTFDFDGSFNGVYWEIPVGANESNGREVEVSVLYAGEGTVGDLTPFELSDAGLDGTYELSSPDEGVLRLKIYSAHEDEEASFTIAYDATGIVTRWEDAGELYWKFVSDGWDVASDDVTCALHLPVPEGGSVLPGDNVRAWGHGPLDASVSFDGNDVVFRVPGVGTDEFAEMRVTFPAEWVAGLEGTPGEALPRVLSEEQRWTDEANARRERARALYFGLVAAGFALAAGTVAAALVRRARYRRETTPRFSDTYFRDVPTADHPAVLGALRNGGDARAKELTATLMRLTDEGVVRLDKVTTRRKGLVREKVEDDYRVTRLRDSAPAPAVPGGPAATASELDGRALHLLFDVVAGGSGEPVAELLFSELDSFAKRHPQRYSDAYDDWKGAVEGACLSRFSGTGELVRGRGALTALAIVDWVVGVVMLVAFVAMDAPVPVALASLVALVGAGTLAAWVAHSMRDVNRDAVEVGAQLDALERWLREFTRLDEAVPTDVALWNRLLVMAVVLGVADEVIDQLRVAVPELLDDPLLMPTYGWFYWHAHGMRPPAAALAERVESAHNVSVAELAGSQASSGGGGGGGFSGGGGGGFGGGGGGGAF